MASIINSTDTGGGGLITTGDSSDELQLQTAETARVTLTNTAVVVNEGGNDVDFRVEGDTEANLLFVDAGNDRVGVGTNTPSEKLHLVNGNFRLDNTSCYIKQVNDTGGWTNGMPSGSLDYVFNYGIASPSERIRILSSGGITFNGDTAAANALDDYEEGTWTPTAYGSVSAGTTTYTLQQGSYTKIGRMVVASARLAYTATTGTGGLFLGGLPFASANDSMEYAGAIMTDFLNWSGGTSLIVYKGANNTYCEIFGSTDDATWSNQAITNETVAMRFTITYFTA